MKRKWYAILPVLLALTFLFSGCSQMEEWIPDSSSGQTSVISLENIPEFSDSAYVELNDNQPELSDEEKQDTQSFETYSELDSLGRCGVAFACIGQDLMPTEDRESISQVKPTGWQTVKYDFVDGKYLYNRCHLIGFQLTGENANEKNLITGTRYMNVEGMLPFENMVADYIKETENHVLYRVTPIFQGEDLVAQGLVMEAYSVEDQGDGICFHVYVYNVQPGVEIEYATGENWATGQEESPSQNAGSASSANSSSQEQDYILNTSSHKFHLPTCTSVEDMSEKNKQSYHGTRDNLLAQGYTPCGNCNP